MSTETIALTRREIVRLSMIAGGISVAAPGWAQFNLDKAIGAGSKVAASRVRSRIRGSAYRTSR